MAERFSPLRAVSEAATAAPPGACMGHDVLVIQIDALKAGLHSTKV